MLSSSPTILASGGDEIFAISTAPCGACSRLGGLADVDAARLEQLAELLRGEHRRVVDAGPASAAARGSRR